MVNKPQALYVEDAQRAFQKDKSLLLEEIDRRFRGEDANGQNNALQYSPTAAAYETRNPQSGQFVPITQQDIISLLRARHPASNNRTFAMHYNALLERSVQDALRQRRTLRQPTSSSSSSSRAPAAPMPLVIQATQLPRNPDHIRAAGPIPPRTMHAILDTGFEFHLFLSSTEQGSFISDHLLDQVRSRSDLTVHTTPSHAHSQANHYNHDDAHSPRQQQQQQGSSESSRLNYGGRFYRSTGTITLALTLRMTNAEDEMKVLEVLVTASIVPGLHPDLFLGK